MLVAIHVQNKKNSFETEHIIIQSRISFCNINFTAVHLHDHTNNKLKLNVNI